MKLCNTVGRTNGRRWSSTGTVSQHLVSKLYAHCLGQCIQGSLRANFLPGVCCPQCRRAKARSPHSQRTKNWCWGCPGARANVEGLLWSTAARNPPSLTRLGLGTACAVQTWQGGCARDPKWRRLQRQGRRARFCRGWCSRLLSRQGQMFRQAGRTNAFRGRGEPCTLRLWLWMWRPLCLRGLSWKLLGEKEGQFLKCFS